MFDVIKSDNIIRDNFLSKLKTAARISKTEYLWVKFDDTDVDLAWIPDKHEKNLIHVFGSDLNHIQAVFANKDKIKQLDEFKDFKLHNIDCVATAQNLVELDEPITSELLITLQEKQETEWMWVVNKYFDYSNIDFTWREDPWTSPKLYAYGNAEQGYKAYLLHKKTNVYGETLKRDCTFNRLYDVIDTNSVVRKTFLQKLKMAARISLKEHFYITNSAFKIDPTWEPAVGEKDFIHVFGSDLNHIQAIFSKKDKVKQLDEFKDYILHKIPNLEHKESVIKTDVHITIDLLLKLQEKQENEWMWVIEDKYNFEDIDFNWRPDPWNEYNYYNFGDKAVLVHKKANLEIPPDYIQKFIGHNYKFNYNVINSETVIRKDLLSKIKTAARIADKKCFWLVFGDYKPDMYWEPFEEEKQFIHIFGSDLNHIQAIFVNKDIIKELTTFEKYKLLSIEDIKMNNIIIECDSLITPEVLRNVQNEYDNEWIWIIDGNYDYDGFDFNWRPDPWSQYNWYNFGNKAFLIHKKAAIDV